MTDDNDVGFVESGCATAIARYGIFLGVVMVMSFIFEPYLGIEWYKLFIAVPVFLLVLVATMALCYAMMED
jgi:hypothetical protein